MSLTEMQGYAYFFLTVFLVVILYGYIEKKGIRDYEKYGKMALNDELSDTPIEANPKVSKEKKE